MHKEKNIIIISHNNDAHAKTVSKALEYFDINSVIIAQSDIQHSISFSTMKEKNELLINNKILYKENSVFWLHRISSPIIDNKNILLAAGEQINAFIKNFYSYIDANHLCVNKYSSIMRCKNKITQLFAAKECGLLIPDTYFISNLNSLINVCNEHGYDKIVCKGIKQSVFMHDNQPSSFFTTRPSEQLFEALSCGEFIPLIAQKRINPSAEIRCLVVGNEILSAKITTNAQNYDDINLILDSQKKFTPINIDDKYKKAIFKTMKKLEIETASFDFILDKNNNMHFIEINESGQFLFMEYYCPDIYALHLITTFFARKYSHTPHLGDTKNIKLEDFMNVPLSNAT